MRIFLLALCACLHVLGWGQTFKGGTVNSLDFNNQYYKVTGIDASKASITVTNASTLELLDKVIIIQMTGASYSTTTGQVTTYNGAGNYEIGIVCKIQGNTIFLVNALLRTYTFTNNAKVQLVKIQKYKSATVNTLLEATPWDSARGTGGVLAISVENTLTLNANISADGKGFKGGTFIRSLADCSDFLPASGNFYDPTNVTAYRSGAYKGESIVSLPLAERGGKGAVANGGGGGNNHNNGGGGGSNLTLGGSGGGNSSTQGCQTPNPGQGGYALDDNKFERVFLGGGGGVGHGNYEYYSEPLSGGSGGGILFIEAGSIVSNGNKITANGQNGSNSYGDGASGGGGGGTIIFNITDPSSVNTEALGGKGGDEDESPNPSGKCFGEGGGGSGGAIYIMGSRPTGIISVKGGAKGLRLATQCPLINEAISGTDGKIFSVTKYSESTSPSSGCPAGAILPVGIIYFKVTHKGSQASAEWKVSRPEDANQYILQRRGGNDDWKDIQVVTAEDRTTTYQKADGPLATGIYLYRLKIVEKDRSVSYSPVQQITIKAEDINRLLIHPNPATSEITIVAPAAGEEWLNIYDMKSRLVYRKKVTPNDSVIKQDVSFLAEGVYMIQVGKLTARFVVFK